MTTTSDIALVRRAAKHDDRTAFGMLVARYQEPVRRFFLSHTLGNKPLADDLAQDTFLRVYRHLGSFRQETTFAAWLFRIACNVFNDYCRSKAANQEKHDRALTAAAETLTTDRATADSSLRIDLYTAMRELSEAERTCITLQLIEGFAIDTIADMTGMPTGTVKSHLSRGKEKLANYLRRNGYE